MTSTKTEELVDLIHRRHFVRARDVEEAGIPRNYLGRLVRSGRLHKIDRGLYTASATAFSEHLSLIEISHRIPKAVICLLSALRFHEIGTQIPSEIWIALDAKARTPKIGYPPLRTVRFSGKALRFGIQEHTIEGGMVRVYSPAKTVADCFKFRNKIGMDVALEALRECYRQKRATMSELWEAAKVCRVANVMRPYMESFG